MQVAEAVGRTLASAGVDHVFGVVGSGNFHLTNAMVAAGATFVATRHEGGAATMADAYARMSRTVAAVSVHQGCGLTNAMTGIAEAAKSRTPMLVLAAEVSERRSNFFVDQEALAQSVGARSRRITSAATAVDEAVSALALALHQRRTVVLNLPLDVQGLDVPAERTHPELPPRPAPVEPTEADLAALVRSLAGSQRPVFIAGRGSRDSGRVEVEALAQRHGALLATSAVARGLFHGNSWSLDVSGGFASPFAAAAIADSDLIVGWGCSLNMWTMRHGTLIGAGTSVVQVDDDAAALGAHRAIDLGVAGDVALTARRALELSGVPRQGRRTPAIRADIAAEHRWRDVAFTDLSEADRIDPRTVSIALDDILPIERVVSVDSGNFMGYPSMFLSVPDEDAFCFTQAFQSIGLGLATAVGAALAQPGRLPVAALGDGGAMMAAAELDTVRRLGLPMVVVVYNDDAYGAEVHHFGPDGHPTDLVRFPPTDIAAVARGYGFEAVTVRTVDDLAAVADWVAGERSSPLLVDAKVVSDTGSWWLDEAFRGH
jgi:acetolactate synthase I/II/III large subunit